MQQEASNILPFTDPMQGFAAGLQLAQVVPLLTRLIELVQAQPSQIERLQDGIARLAENSNGDYDRWLSAEQAAAHMGLSINTFDKYRYNTKVKIKGYRLDGSLRYKKSDLDRFILTYDVKSRGLA